MKVRFRTSLVVLSVSAVMALLSAFVVSFGGTKMTRGDLLDIYPLWPYFVLALGVTGVLLLLSKGRAIPPFIDQKIPGYLAGAPLAVAVVVTAYYRSGPALAFFLLALPAAIYAAHADEPPGTRGTHDLNDFLAAGLLLLFGLFGHLLPIADPFLPTLPTLVFASIIASAAAYACWRDPEGARARLARVVVGVALLVIGGAAFFARQPVFSVIYVPVGLVVALYPWTRKIKMGYSAEPGLTEENVVVDSFEKIAELTAWSVYIFTLIHSYFNPPGLSLALFWMFVAAFVIFSIEYEAVPARWATYESTQRKSMTNAILLALISHLTGGLHSPYAWFFILILTSGAFVPDPKMILRRLGAIAGYYVIETAYSAYYGLVNEAVIVDELMVQVFVVGLVGVYAYRLALRRKQIDDDLMSKNESLRKALEGERAAKQLVEKQTQQSALDKKYDEALLASLADGVVACGPDGRILSLNPSAEGLIGLSTAQSAGKRFRDLVEFGCEGDPEFRIGKYLDTALHGNAIPLPEGVYIDQAGGRRAYLRGIALPIMDEEKKVTGMVVTLSDITYTHEVDQMKTGFLSIAAHQLRTPLSTVRWYLELLNDPTEGKLKKNQKMFAENAYLSLRKMVGLVNRLLAVTRLESGRVPFKPEPTDLKRMTRDIFESLKPKFEEKKLAFTEDLPDLPSVSLDRTLAREVFLNLIENAIRYTPEGGHIDVSAHEEEGRIVWRVKDDGIGIPKAQQEKIFEKFFRAANAVEYSSEGSGLGLYLAKFIVTAWGGEIGFDSEEGKGATFRVTIPKKGMKAKSGQVSLNA